MTAAAAARSRSLTEKLGLLRELELFSGLSSADIEISVLIVTIFVYATRISG